MMEGASALGLFFAFGGGMVSFLSPCVLPLVPGYLAWVAGTDLEGAQDRRLRTMLLACCFVLGFGAVFVALGAAADGVSGLLRRWSYEAQIAGGVLVLGLGLLQLGVIPIPMALLRDRRFRPAVTGGSPAQAALVGVAFGFGWTPCIGPILGAILGVAAAGGGDGMALLGAYALGLGVPFLAVAAYMPLLLGRARRMARAGFILQRVAGALMVAMGLLMITGNLTIIAVWLLETFPMFTRIG
jgi:cytochrome c-type biogenesis protein